MAPNPFEEKNHQAKLRTAAEAQLERSAAAKAPARPSDELLHELQVHQIELEMQNEELRRAYVALEESRDRYVDLYEFAPIGYLTLTHDGLISEINLTGATLLDEDRKKLLHRRFAKFISAEDRDRWHRHFLLTLQHIDRQNCELLLQRGDSTTFHAHLDCLCRVTDDDSPTVRIALTDISERKQIELALQQADRHKAEFLAMLAHELRNPLVPIRNAAHIIGLLGLDEPRIQWAQKLIESQVEYITRMVDDLLDISRLTFNKIAIKKQSFDFAKLLGQVLESARPLAEKKQQQITVRLPEQTVQLEGDPMRLAQVLFNLLENAVKYTPDGGQIDFSASMAGPEIRISIQDNGMGITPELLPRVFDLFLQGACTLDRPEGGMGIGLTLVKHLVEKHGGRVKASSPGPGLGSSFMVWLPVEVGARPIQPPAARPEYKRCTTPTIRVLVVDDDPAVADSTLMLLEMVGYDARTAGDGQAALDLIPEYRPRVVLLDIGLKGMDGFEVAQKIRELPEGRNLYLLAMTGYGDKATRSRAMASGFDQLLVKPMRLNDLEKLLEKAAESA